MKIEKVSTVEKIGLRTRYLFNTLTNLLHAGEQPRKIIFIHVPKTAGTSTWKQIKAIVGPRSLGFTVRLHRDPDPFEDDYEELIGRCRRALFVSGHISWSTVEDIRGGSDAFTFTILRDPAERLKSLYRFFGLRGRSLRNAGPPYISRRIANMTPIEFFQHRSPMLRWHCDNFITRQFAGTLGNIYLTEDEGHAMLERAKANLATLDFIGFQENYEEDLSEIFRRLGLPNLRRVRRMYATTSDAGETNTNTNTNGSFDEDLMPVIEPLIRFDKELVDFAAKIRSNTHLTRGEVSKGVRSAFGT